MSKYVLLEAETINQKFSELPVAHERRVLTSDKTTPYCAKKCLLEQEPDFFRGDYDNDNTD